jgi:hypothetical protein
MWEELSAIPGILNKFVLLKLKEQQTNFIYLLLDTCFGVFFFFFLGYYD